MPNKSTSRPTKKTTTPSKQRNQDQWVAAVTLNAAEKDFLENVARTYHTDISTIFRFAIYESFTGGPFVYDKLTERELKVYDQYVDSQYARMRTHQAEFKL